MSRQLTLFGPPAASPSPSSHRSDPSYPSAPHRPGQETQAAGAAAIEPHRRGLCARILAYLRAQPNGATNEELRNALAIRLQTICGRIAELRDAGLIVDSGARRRGASGVRHKVWRVTAEGRAVPLSSPSYSSSPSYAVPKGGAQ